jgi:putative hydrolase of the HAD superfamily
MQKEESIKNILFDLGGVILDIHVQATLKAFYDLGFPPHLLQYPLNMDTDLFYRYETGKIDSSLFRDEMRRISGVEVEDAALDEAWNAMIIGIPEERVRLIERLGKQYRLFMLSNTSALHAPVFEAMYLEKAGIPMEKAFEKIYYSFRIGCHKPDHTAWEYVLKDAGILAGETLFLDDNIHNIKASQELGFKAIHIHERMGLLDLGFDL